MLALLGPALAHAVVLRSSVLRVELLPSREVFTQSWLHTPLVDLQAVAGEPRFVLSVDTTAFWFDVHLHVDVVRLAQTTESLEAGIDVALSPTQSIGSVVVSNDVAEALRALEIFGLEAQLRALGMERTRIDRDVTLTLARIAKQRALRRLGVA